MVVDGDGLADGDGDGDGAAIGHHAPVANQCDVKEKCSSNHVSAHGTCKPNNRSWVFPLNDPFRERPFFFKKSTDSSSNDVGSQAEKQRSTPLSKLFLPAIVYYPCLPLHLATVNALPLLGPSQAGSHYSNPHPNCNASCYVSVYSFGSSNGCTAVVQPMPLVLFTLFSVMRAHGKCTQAL